MGAKRQAMGVERQAMSTEIQATGVERIIFVIISIIILAIPKY
jgi:hypothetical protein